MTNPLLGSNYVYDQASGQFISAKHQRIAEIIQDYNPELELLWIPPGQRGAEDTEPYVIVHNRDGRKYPVFYLSEIQMEEPKNVLARLFAGDLSKHSPGAIYSMIELSDRAQQVYDAKVAMDKLEERQDFAAHLLKSPLHTYKHNRKKYRS